MDPAITYGCASMYESTDSSYTLAAIPEIPSKKKNIKTEVASYSSTELPSIETYQLDVPPVHPPSENSQQIVDKPADNLLRTHVMSYQSDVAVDTPPATSAPEPSGDSSESSDSSTTSSSDSSTSSDSDSDSSSWSSDSDTSTESSSSSEEDEEIIKKREAIARQPIRQWNTELQEIMDAYTQAKHKTLQWEKLQERQQANQNDSKEKKNKSLPLDEEMVRAYEIQFEMLTKLRNLSGEFKAVAEEVATTIIDEMLLPNKRKTYRPKTEFAGIAGGEKYMEKGIFFKVTVNTSKFRLLTIYFMFSTLVCS